MIRNKNDIERSNKLIESLNNWSKKTNNKFIHETYQKETETLYRFGWFYINNYKYSISGWKFMDDIVTFECETSGTKVKFDINVSNTLNNSFKRDNLIRKIRSKMSLWLKDLSDKLRP